MQYPILQNNTDTYIMESETKKQRRPERRQKGNTMYILWNGSRKIRYETLEEAARTANEITRKTGYILTITEEQPKREKGR